MVSIQEKVRGALIVNDLEKMNNIKGVSDLNNAQSVFQTQPFQSSEQMFTPSAQTFTQSAQSFQQTGPIFKPPAQTFSQPAQNFQQSTQTFNQPAQMFTPSASYSQASNENRMQKGVDLVKGQKTSLSKISPNLSEITVCLSWGLNLSDSRISLDGEAFLLGSNNKVLGDDWFVFYNQPTSPDNAVTYTAYENKNSEGDNAVINIKLHQLNSNVSKIVFVITINEALTYGFNFSHVCNAYIRVIDKNSNKELIRFNLTDYYKEVTSMMVGELYNKGGEWRFNPIGDGVAKDLLGLCEMYGVVVEG